MKLFKKLKRKFKKDRQNDFTANMSANDRLFYILNIGNYEFAKNRKYIVDEIVFRLESGHPVKNIAKFISNFVKKTWDIKINKNKLIHWINDVYKYKIEAIKARHGFRKS